MRTRIFVFFCLVMVPGSTQVHAQQGPVLPYDDSALWATNALLARGYLQTLEPGTFPLYESAYLFGLQGVKTGNPAIDQIISRTRSRLYADSSLSSGRYGIRIRPGVTLASQEGADFLRPERNPKDVIYSRLSYESWFSAGNFTAAWGWRHDRYYDRDPEGLDTAHRWAIRPENAYLSYAGTYAQVLLGRVRQQWGGYLQPGLLLSDNPRPMDHLSLRIGTDRLNIRSSLSELDSITGDGRFSGIAGDDSVSSGSERRYLAVHKLTYSKPGAWSVGLMHSILYSGANSGWSLKFMNPFQLAILSVDDRPKNDENNGLLGAFVQVQRPLTLIQAQVALDDFDIVNGKEPASVAATIHVYRADLVPHMDLETGGTVVTMRTYNAEQTEGRYLYLRRGIATEYTDFATAFVAAPIFAGRGTIITPRLDVLFQGEGDILRPFPGHDEAPTIFDGTLERTLRFSVDTKVMLHHSIDLQIQAGFNSVQNADHVEGRSDTYFSGSLSIGYRHMWKGAF